MSFIDTIKNIITANSLKDENSRLTEKIRKLEQDYESSGFADYQTAQNKLKEIHSELDERSSTIDSLNTECEKLLAQRDKLDSQVKSNEKKVSKLKEAYNSISYSIKKCSELPDSVIKIPNFSENEIDELVPSVVLNTHCMDCRDLRKSFNENDKRITELIEKYSSRYTTKANKTIYSLMVIALRAELQNILYDLKYQKLDKGIENVKAVTEKYMNLVCDGNQSIAPTVTRFIGELEYFFINAVKIEYDYYVRKEQARQEQLAIREQMRQEAEERKALEAERKKIEHEESKFKNQIEDITAKLENADESEADKLRKRLLELEVQLSSVVQKKEDIVNLQNGKAGNVYIISNIGSFGEDVFKIGMTRRLDPQDRVDELGSASVPFGFDVHSFIFSDDAVSLENELHKRLNDHRVNKVNMRKEFFRISLDELEELTHSISPTSEFVRTMAAEEYRQSISSNDNYEPTNSTFGEADEEDKLI
ncbi:MAG: GIY-YIG nuclease family protein [Clostridiales bacterium]|nr:GIY-YIG nuclease family protein [Clostridiales bacterium]